MLQVYSTQTPLQVAGPWKHVADSLMGTIVENKPANVTRGGIRPMRTPFALRTELPHARPCSNPRPASCLHVAGAPCSHGPLEI
jgi:hypothetical protein